MFYEVIDGHRRLKICKKLRMMSVPCRILENISEIEALKLQFILNYHRFQHDEGYFEITLKRIMSKYECGIDKLCELLKLDKENSKYIEI